MVSQDFGMGCKMRCLLGFLAVFSVLNVVSIAHAQWWGSESLPGNPGYYTYKTRFGYWQYGALERNISTPQPFADRGIIRNWNDGAIIAVDRNIPGSRFAQRGTPNLVYVPQIDYFDSYGELTDVRYRSGLRQYWPEDRQLLNHEWEQITYEPDQKPVTSTGVAVPSVSSSVTQESATSPRHESRNRVQTVVIQQVPAKTAQPKLSYHQRVMQKHAERRAAEEERIQQYAKQLAEQKAQQDERRRRFHEQEQIAPLWFRDQRPLQQ